MYDYSILPNRIILCINLRSFYASVSCIKMGLDPLCTILAVVDDINRGGSIITGIDTAFNKEMDLPWDSTFLLSIPNYFYFWYRATSPPIREFHYIIDDIFKKSSTSLAQSL